MYPETIEHHAAHPAVIHGEPNTAAERARREQYLEELLEILKLEADGPHADSAVNHRYDSWAEWQAETGELPPDFERMPAHGALPNPLEHDLDGQWETISDPGDWDTQRNRLKMHLQYWVYGARPPAPDRVTATELGQRTGEDATAYDLELSFADEEAATIGVELIVPEGDGPFPVFMTQWNHRKWAEVAVQRGYLAAVYAGADRRDDTEGYGPLFPEYDFQVLLRRAWGASRVIDYLEDRPEADTDRIGITGHSRNGKQSLLAAAFDERISAVVVGSAGSGAVVPARLDRDDCHAGDMSYHARLRRSWFHPRWRFFVGNEHYLPVDANSLISLVAPRACCLFTASNELTGNSFGIDQAFESAREVYRVLDAEDRLGLKYRGGNHGTATRDLETIVDAFDAAFADEPLPVERFHAFDYDTWANNRTIPEPPRNEPDPIPADQNAWEASIEERRATIQWSLGSPSTLLPDPPGLGEEISPRSGRRGEYVAQIIGRPEATETIGKRSLSRYHTAGRPFGGDLYYPRSHEEEEPADGLPAVVWLHPFAYNGGYGNPARRHVPVKEATRQGLCLYSFDQVGFGTRIFEQPHFYDRYPDWSRMGKMVEEVRAAVRTVQSVDFIDPDRVCVAGYSVGATAGLYAAALDPEIPAVASVCGVPALRASTAADATIERLVDHHGLQPQLGAYADDPTTVPFDFDEVMGLVAPRPQLIVTPTRDWTHPHDAVSHLTDNAAAVYEAYKAGEQYHVHEPDDILSFDYHEARLEEACLRSGETPPIGTPRRDFVFEWIADTFGA